MDKKMFDKGMGIRRAVLGDAYVDRAVANMNDFNKPLQELVTQYCWGEVWRPGIEQARPQPAQSRHDLDPQSWP